MQRSASGSEREENVFEIIKRPIDINISST